MYKLLGLALISVGFLIGALAAVQHATDQVVWSWYLPGLILGMAGVVLRWIDRRQATRHSTVIGTNLERLDEALDQIVRGAHQLQREGPQMHPSDVHTLIDRLFPVPLHTFVEARQTMAHAFGLAAYAEVMNAFAAGERYLNRTWSASVDGYIDEVHRCLDLVVEHFDQTRRVYHQLRSSQAVSDPLTAEAPAARPTPFSSPEERA